MIAQLKGFEKAGKLEVNDDINYTEFSLVKTSISITA
jgi:hypothetical protein